MGHFAVRGGRHRRFSLRCRIRPGCWQPHGSARSPPLSACEVSRRGMADRHDASKPPSPANSTAPKRRYSGQPFSPDLTLAVCTISGQLLSRIATRMCANTVKIERLPPRLVIAVYPDRLITAMPASWYIPCVVYLRAWPANSKRGGRQFIEYELGKCGKGPGWPRRSYRTLAARYSGQAGFARIQAQGFARKVNDSREKCR